MFVIDEGDVNSNSNETLLIIHGFPSSSFDFIDCIDIFKEKFKRIILIDHLGFGFSDKPFNWAYSIQEYTDCLIQVYAL